MVVSWNNERLDIGSHDGSWSQLVDCLLSWCDLDSCRIAFFHHGEGKCHMVQLLSNGGADVTHN